MLTSWLTTIVLWVVPIVNVAAATAVTIHAVLWKRDTRAVIAWVGLAWLAPIVGPLAYFFFGINRLQRRAIALRVRQGVRWRPHIRLSEVDRVRIEEIEGKYPSLVGLARLGHALTDRELLPGNAITPLPNGDTAFPAMLAAIERAERSVSLVSYIFDVDRAGEQFRAALVRAQGRGVEVRVLIDHVGARYSRPTMLRILQRDGLNAAGFMPTRFPVISTYANLRNHRKILVVDGRTGFTGGTNIRESHWLSLSPASAVDCVHFQVEGPVVTELQATFAIDWAFTTGESLSGDGWFPELERVGDVWARGVPDGPDEDFEKMTNTLVGALASASRTVKIVTPYFVPHGALIQALNVAALRGVTVDIVLPANNNLPFVNWAATAMFWQLLEKGCRIFLSEPNFDHSKLMVVDGMWSLIGSTNWDARSLRLNFEFNVECYDADLARGLEQMIAKKITRSRRVTLADVNSRSWPVQLRDGLSRLLTPYL